MQQETKDYINCLTEAILKKYQLSIPITDVSAVVQMLGGQIVEMVGLDLFNGTIRKDSNQTFTIAINKHQSQSDKNIEMLRQLGHLFLHMGFHTNTNLWIAQYQDSFRRFSTTEQFLQANEFAMSILMPKSQFLDVLNQHTKNGIVDINIIAKTFNVSRYMAIYRGQSLGVIKLHN